MDDPQTIKAPLTRPRHTAQLFDSVETRIATASSFIAAALDAGHNMLVIARRAHSDALELELTRRGYDLASARRPGALVVLEASSTLDRISRDGVPVAPLFERVLGRLIGRLSAGAELSTYGEMVDVLAERAEFRAVLKLEDLWNLCSMRYPFTLLCGYSSAHFVGHPGDLALEAVCRAHGGVHAGADDPLGQWMLGAAAI